MTTKLQTYPKYKDSGVEWFDRIPLEWKTIRNLGIFSERIERAKGGEELLSVSISRGVTKQSELENEKDSSNDDKSNYKITEPNDIAYNKMRMWQGAVGVSRYHGIVSPAYIILKPKSGVEPRYLHYQYKTQVYNELSYQYGHGIVDDQHSLRYWQFKALHSILPPLNTQQRIADFLDGKTKIVDELIEKKEKLIALLREKRTALITRAVTKGLDPRATLKPSGVEWLGRIPAGWKLKRLKFIARLQYGESLSNENREIGEVQVYGSNGPVGVHSEANTKAPAIIVGRKGSFGAVNYTGKAVFAIDTTYFVDERWSKDDLKWLSYCMSVANLNDISFDTGVPGLSREAVHNKLFPLPNVREQKQVADFLDTETAKIDKAVALIEAQIEKLKEYRSSLIYSAVTGKIKI